MVSGFAYHTTTTTTTLSTSCLCMTSLSCKQLPGSSRSTLRFVGLHYVEYIVSNVGASQCKLMYVCHLDVGCSCELLRVCDTAIAHSVQSLSITICCPQHRMNCRGIANCVQMPQHAFAFHTKDRLKLYV